jgi:predicted GNAT superfamily acetyltransferase
MTGSNDADTITAMADLPAAGGTMRDLAVPAADAAALAAGVVIRDLHTRAEFDEVCALFQSIWRPSQQNPPVTAELLTALVKAGNYVAGAYQAHVLAGACVGFFAAPTDGGLHSHIAGVSSAARGGNIGFALKLHQRAWALSRGVTTISWTFDPLVRRNAYFNLVKLAADPVEYLPDFYGAMHDNINGDDDTDRLLVRWHLEDPRVHAACSHAQRGTNTPSLRRADAVVGLGVSADGGPLAGALAAGTVLVAVPADIEAMRAVDPVLARRWRIELRGTLGTLLGRGGRVIGFDRTDGYVVTTEGGALGPAVTS